MQPRAESPSRTSFGRALLERHTDRDLVDAIIADPERVEAGWLPIARDVDLGENLRLPLLALDATRRLAVVSTDSGFDSDRQLFDALRCHRHIASQMPLLRKIVSSVARPEIGPLTEDEPRLVLLAPDPPRRGAPIPPGLADVDPEWIRYRFLRVGSGVVLHLEKLATAASPLVPSAPLSSPVSSASSVPPAVPLSSARSASGSALPSGAAAAQNRSRLLADARSRVLNLSPEITALEIEGGLAFRYRGRDLARFEPVEGGLRLVTSREPEGRRILGRSDLEEGLHGVIEEFFAVYASTLGTHEISERTRGSSRTLAPAAPDATPRSRSAPRDAQTPPAPPMAPRASGQPDPGSSILTREEIEAFLRDDPDDDDDDD